MIYQGEVNPMPGRLPAKRRTAWSRVLLAVWVGAIMASCASLPETESTHRAALVGTIRDTDGRPVAGAEVRINDQAPVCSGANGLFTATEVPLGHVRITVAHDEYLRFEETLEFTERTQVLYIQLMSIAHAISTSIARSRSGNLSQARKLAEDSVAGLPDNLELRFVAALLAVRSGDHAAASRHLRAFPAQNTFGPVVRLRSEIQSGMEGIE